jgi:uncharacterized membrane protein (DUF373 family)
MSSGTPDTARTRDWVRRAFTWIEDIVYVGLGVLLSGCALTLLVAGGIEFWQQLTAGTLAGTIVQLLDRLLLILLIIEVLYTVQVSLREHTLSPEPFLLVGLIAVVRRLLVLMAELPKMVEKADQVVFRQVSTELGLLSLMIVALVISLAVLRRRPGTSGTHIAVRP